MKISLEASAGTVELITALKTAPARLRQVQRTEAFWLGEALVNRAKTEYRNAPRTTPRATKVRTGHLRDSYRHSPVTDTGSGVQFDFGVLSPSEGNALVYAGVHEFGATIKAKGGGWLKIPIGPWSNAYTDATSRGRSALTERGVARAGAGDVGNLFRGRGSLRSDILYQRQGEGIMPMFLLRRQVTVPPRPALLPSVQDVLPTWVERFTAALDKATTG